jgi:hypothetical protein
MDLNVREWGAKLVDNFMIFNLLRREEWKESILFDLVNNIVVYLIGAQ